MCRVLVYLGRKTKLEDIVIKPSISIVKQALFHRYGQVLNLAGFGLSGWTNDSSELLVYKSLDLPFFDRNLESICRVFQSTSFLAHIRGVELTTESIVSEANIHPFISQDQTISFAHNGFIYGFENIKKDLLKYIKDQYLRRIHGTTDSEYLFALLMSQLKSSDDLVDEYIATEAIKSVIDIIKRVRRKNNITIPSAMNLFISHRDHVITTRYVFDYGRIHPNQGEPQDSYQSMWYTLGHEFQPYQDDYQMSKGPIQSLIVSSEPLTKNTTSWLQVPSYSMLYASQVNGQIQYSIIELD